MSLDLTHRSMTELADVLVMSESDVAVLGALEAELRYRLVPQALTLLGAVQDALRRAHAAMDVATDMTQPVRVVHPCGAAQPSPPRVAQAAGRDPLALAGSPARHRGAPAQEPPAVLESLRSRTAAPAVLGEPA